MHHVHEHAHDRELEPRRARREPRAALAQRSLALGALGGLAVSVD
jgi:hypothetical protein